MFEAHGQTDKLIQSRFVGALADVDLQEALRVQKKLPLPVQAQLLEDEEYLG